jgi:hypothetical protein
MVICLICENIMNDSIYDVIRYDWVHHIGSALDVIGWLTGKGSSYASSKLSSVFRSHPDLRTHLRYIKWEGQGQPTPFAPLNVLCVIAWHVLYGRDAECVWKCKYIVMAFAPEDVMRPILNDTTLRQYYYDHLRLAKLQFLSP